MTNFKTREFDVFGVPAHLLAATDVTFQGRTAPIAGFPDPTGVVRVGATTDPRGTSMI
jgi:hypothetical protein